MKELNRQTHVTCAALIFFKDHRSIHINLHATLSHCRGRCLSLEHRSVLCVDLLKCDSGDMEIIVNTLTQTSINQCKIPSFDAHLPLQ